MDVVKKNLTMVSKPLGSPYVRGFLVLLGLAHASCIAQKVPAQVSEFMTKPLVCIVVMYAVVYAHTGNVIGSLGATIAFLLVLRLIGMNFEGFTHENPNVPPSCRGITFDDILVHGFGGDEEAMRLAVLNHSNSSNADASEVAIQLVNAGYDLSGLGCNIDELRGLAPNYPAGRQSPVQE